jgi:hypothetical protein
MVAFGGQYLMRRTERQERYDALLLEQFALIIALSEDFQGRVWEERHQVASDVVGKRDFLTLRLAQARLRVLSQDPKVMVALRELYDAGADLDKAWRLATDDKVAVDTAYRAHHDAIEHFVAVSSQVIRHQPLPASDAKSASTNELGP